MNIKLAEILSGLKIRQSTGIIYSLWSYILPLISGIVFGYFADVLLSYGMDKFSFRAGMTDSSVSAIHETGESVNTKRTLDEFLRENPFRISPVKQEVKAEAPKPKEEPKAPEKDTTLDKLVVRGTLPGIGIWYEADGKLDLLLVGKYIGRYRLSGVNYREAMFYRGRERIKKYITYGPVVKAQNEEKKPVPKPERKEDNNDGNQIVAAQPGAQEGQISSEMVSQLVQNPFDEMKRIRLRPSDKDGGLEVQWIQSDSILKRLGVQRGDVIKSVNGIPFTNMGDIANSISSLMNSERFDVEVTRGGKSEALRYVVK